MLFGFSVNPVLVILGGRACRMACACGSQLPRRQRRACGRNSHGCGRPCCCSARLQQALRFYTCLTAELFSLALLMFKIDLFAFGGGYTSVPLMFHEIVEVRGWLDGKTLLDGIALGQLTPGPIVITATFVGYLLKGVAGAAAATVCIFLPSFLMVVTAQPRH